jgi:hypothetical protein
MRFSRFFSKFSKNIFSIELFPSREQTEQKKKNQLNMSSVMIESAYKNYNFLNLSEFSDFPLYFSHFFFNKRNIKF